MIEKFTDLIVWKEAHVLVLLAYKMTNHFPPNERFGIINQIRRASVSISSNIAEGFGRISMKDKSHFYLMSRSSLREVENQFLIARDLNYIDRRDFILFEKQADLVGRLLTGLLKSVRQKI